MSQRESDVAALTNHGLRPALRLKCLLSHAKLVLVANLDGI